MNIKDIFLKNNLNNIGGKENIILLILFLFSFLLSLFIFLVISGFFNYNTKLINVSLLLIFNSILVFLIILFISYKVRNLLLFRKEGRSGSYLQIQLSSFFAIITFIPSILVTIFSILFFDQGIKTWFTEKVNTAISGSKFISESYFKEHSNNLKNDILFLSKEINNEKVAFFTDRERLTTLLNSLASVKFIDEVIIFERSGQLLAKYGSSFVIDKEPPPPLWSLFRADDGEISVFTNKTNDRVRGIVKLNRVIPTYLYAGRNVDSMVLSRVNSVNDAANQYLDLEKNIENFQKQFYILFIAINLLVIMLAIWFGLLFAGRIIFPIKTIINASEKISSGDLKTRIKKFSQFNDFNTLSNSLNKMVDKLIEQKKKLIRAKENINIRRKFTENVIEGITAGIIYLDLKLNIVLYNKRSKEIFNKSNLNGNILDIFPEIEDILKNFILKDFKSIEKQVRFADSTSQKIINIKINSEVQNKKRRGIILTFDDVTELVSAQKKAAWSNVARYLAHEIRNPLTPIKISAQRLQKNFLKNVLNNNTLETCTSTIVRQVNDIEKLVTEFSDFARMPTIILKKENIYKIIKQEIDSLKIINKKVDYRLKSKYKNIIVNIDKSQIRRVIVNLLKNSLDAIENKKNKIICVEIIKGNDFFEIIFMDNGDGFPNDIDKLFEPYITHKKNGTGLGLPICKKIIEDHSGEIILGKSKELGGASVNIKLFTHTNK